MPNVRVLVTPRSIDATLAALLLCLLLPTGLSAQTAQEAEDVARSLAICKGDPTAADDDDNRFSPCEQYIDANVENSADTVKWMIEEIDQRKDYAQDITYTYDARDEILQWILIILSLLTTISAAIAKAYPKLTVKRVDIAIVPIILSAMIAAVTSVGAYYQFDEYRRISQNMADDLTELELDINFTLLRHVAGRQNAGPTEIREETINDWHDRLLTILQRYSARETGNGV